MESKAGLSVCNKRMAERVGFEPTIPFQVCPLSRRVVSTTHAPLRNKKLCRSCPASPKKCLHLLTALLGENTGSHIHQMVELGMIQHLQYRLHRSGFWVISPINQ